MSNINLEDAVLYEIYYNRDQTEGRGPIVSMNKYFTDLEEAVDFVTDQRTINKYGVQGSQTLEIMAVTFVNEGAYYTKYSQAIWGYRSKPDGTWDYGYKDLRDFVPDGDYAQYLLLKERYEK